MSEEWELYYWPISPGRGEFVRYLFEEAGVKYIDHRMKNSMDDMYKLIIKGDIGGYPVFAPPVLKKGDFQMCQTHAICRYLGKEFGLYPENKEDELHAEQISLTCHDYIAEGRLAFHGINHTASHFTQQKETQVYIDRFLDTRLARWWNHFEALLKANNGGSGFLVGNKLTYADLAMLYVLRSTQEQFPEVWEKMDYIPLLKAYKARIEARRNLAAYFKSDRFRPFAGDSFM